MSDSELTMLVMLIIALAFVMKVISIFVNKSYREEHREEYRDANQVEPMQYASAPVSALQEQVITETGIMIYYANDRYNQEDKEYRFRYKKVDNSWRAYIIRMPDLQNRESKGEVTHRLFDNGTPYVCWDTDVKSLKDMQTISKLWADSLQEYIATGKHF